MTTNAENEYRSSDIFLSSKNDRVTIRRLSSTQPENEWQAPSVGRPSSKSLVSWNDVGLLLAVLVCFAVAIGSVFPPRAAVFLGQTNQLVVVGFCLALMAIVCQKQVSHVTLLYFVQRGKASLQDLEAILQNQFFVAKSSSLCKAMIFMLTAVPLALSVGYKRCVGGSSVVSGDGIAGYFGLAAAPGYQRIGLGLSLIPETYLPFWINPDATNFYGFNLLVGSNTTAAVLDAPLPEYLTRLQASLRHDESVLLTTVVNATVSETVPIPSSLRGNDSYWQNLEAQYGTGNWVDLDMVDGHHVAVANGPSPSNRTTSFVSIYREEEGQTVGSQIQQTFNTRREVRGTWRITPSSVTLTKGDLLETQDEALSRHNQSLVDNNIIDVVGLYSRFVAEYDWTRYPRNGSTNTVPSLMAVLLWARIVAQCGVENNGSADIWREVNKYSKSASEVSIRRERETLKPNFELLVVLLVLPVVSVLAFLAKMWFYSCPVDDGFGLISLLAAVNSTSLGGLYGAGLSGKLKHRVGIRFDVVDDEKIEAHVGENGRPPQLQRSRRYA